MAAAREVAVATPRVGRAAAARAVVARAVVAGVAAARVVAVVMAREALAVGWRGRRRQGW